MFGVVLWSSQSEGKAVIWCEDHGDLAFYNADSDAHHDAILGFDAGDLVQFELSQEKYMRRASNARLVKEGQFPGLPDDLLGAGTPTPKPSQTGHARPAYGQVIPFQARGGTKRDPKLRHLA